MSDSSPKNQPKSICDQAAKKSPKVQQTDPPKKATAKAPLLEFPHFLRKIGPNHIRTMMLYMPNAAIWGLTSVLGAIYVTDWRAVVQYLPYYNGKFAEEADVDDQEAEQIETDVENQKEAKPDDKGGA